MHQSSSRLGFVSLICLLIFAPEAFAKPKDKHALPPRDTSGVDHIVVVMMENRSFDHLLGWHPTADARQAGSLVSGSRGGQRARAHAPALARSTTPGADTPIPIIPGRAGARSTTAARWTASWPARTTSTRSATTSTPIARSMPPWRTEFTTFDRFFSSILAGHVSQPHLPARRADGSAREFARALDPAHDLGPPDREGRERALLLLRRLVPLAVGNQVSRRSRSLYEQFLDDAAAGTLPSVAFVEPRFIDEPPAPPATTIRSSTSATATHSSPRSSTRSRRDRTGRRPS